MVLSWTCILINLDRWLRLNTSHDRTLSASPSDAVLLIDDPIYYCSVQKSTCNTRNPGVVMNCLAPVCC